MNLNEKISEHFTWRDALYLPQWEICFFPSKEQHDNILTTAEWLEKVQYVLGGRKLTILSWARPDVYNTFLKSLGYRTAINSLHKDGRAVDFTAEGISCDQARSLLKPVLTLLNIRLEDNPGSSWVHCDDKPVDNEQRRYFKP